MLNFLIGIYNFFLSSWFLIEYYLLFTILGSMLECISFVVMNDNNIGKAYAQFS